MAEHPIPLLPCPWCVSENVGFRPNDDRNYPMIRCLDCGSAGPEFDSCEDDAKAIAAWNKGPYADRFEIHAAALKAHADKLRAKAQEHLAKADALMKKAEATNG